MLHVCQIGEGGNQARQISLESSRSTWKRGNTGTCGKIIAETPDLVETCWDPSLYWNQLRHWIWLSWRLEIAVVFSWIPGIWNPFWDVHSILRTVLGSLLYTKVSIGLWCIYQGLNRGCIKILRSTLPKYHVFGVCLGLPYV
jgi:hypothetical protein